MSPFLPRWVREIAEEVSEAPDWLVHQLLPLGAVAILAAYPKVGKSTLASQLTVAIAQGRSFLGRPTRRNGVLCVVAEEHKADVVRRLRQFGMSDADAICLWTETATDTAADRDLMKRFIATNNLVIIDTWASYLMIQDETNNSEVTRRMMPYVEMARGSGATILFVHHERKNRDEGGDDARAIRGGGAILALVDLAYQLQRDGSETGRKLKIVGRYSEVPAQLKLDYLEGEYVSLGTPEEHSRIALRDKSVAVLPSTGPGLTVAEVVKATHTRAGAVRAALEGAYAVSIVERSGSGKKGSPFRYRRVVATPQESTAELVIVGAGDTELTEV
jgi:hypothetical protein